MTRIETLVLLTAAFLLFLSILGSRRRQSKNFFIQKGVFLTYTLSSSLISYTFGSMQSSAVRSNMYPIWAVSLYFLLIASVDTTAYSLTDHNQSTKLYYRSSLDLVYALLISSSISSHVGFFLVYAMVILVILRFGQRIWASNMATKSWNLNKIVSDYMEEEHKHGQAYDPCKMDGYRYLVDWPLQDIKLELEDGISYRAAALLAKNNTTQVVDVEKVWRKLDNIKGRSLSSNVKFHMELRDACLSFSLFHLLRRRFFGYACSESSQPKTHDFVFKGLLLDHNGAIDHTRVFKVIEVELAFTKYAYLYYGSRAAPYWSLVTASLMFVTAYLTATGDTRILTSLDVSFLYSNSTVMIDMVITMLILTCIAVLEVLKQLLFWTSIWGRVSLVCQYVREEASSTRGCGWWCMKLKEILARIGVHAWNQHYWRDRLDQYSLLESVPYNGRPAVCDPIAVKVENCFRKCVRSFLGSLFLVGFAAYYPVGHRRGGIDRKPKEKDSIKLPAGVKDALVQCLQRTQGVLTNGKSALVSNRAYDLLWALGPHDKPVYLKTGNQTVIILTWHIATCYCEMAPSSENLCSDDFVAATKLSKYCAYLVVAAPKLLPGHHFDTTLVFDEFAAEACFILGHSKGKEAKRHLMASSHEGEGKFFHNGVKLGKQLEKMEERWKVLADFWSEMLLYLAPSDNVTEHIECLAKGGEFITHLWALLTHAGILDRSQIDIESAAVPTTRTVNQPMTQGNYVRSAEMKVQKGENNLVQNVEGTPNAAPSDVEEIK